MSAAHSSQQKLVDMANQMADYFRSLPVEEGLPGAADHIKKFWTPKMRDRIIHHLDSGAPGLDPFAAKAVGLLKAGKTPQGERKGEHGIGESEA